MKKIMIALAAVAMAIGAQAAAANWQITAANIYNGTPDTKYAGVAYLFDATSVSQATIFEAFAAGSDISASSIATATVAAGGITTANSQFSYGEQGGGSYSYFFALVQDDAIFLSKTVAATANGTATPKTIGYGSLAPTTGNTSKAINTSGTAEIGTWNAAAIPEPTSGLLLLLGMAGLALKRKQA